MRQIRSVRLGAVAFLSALLIGAPVHAQGPGGLMVLRAQHSATLLADGRILVAGGFDAGGELFTSAELYDVTTGTSVATGSMTTARRLHTATLLADGRVLVMGGFDPETDGPIVPAELYDPASGRFVPADGLSGVRDGRVVTLLADGRVLLIGGPGDALSDSYELFDPSTGTLTTAGGAPPYDTATLLGDGRVLLAGGMVSGGSAEVYDPATGVFTPTGPMAQDRYGPTATLLADGRVLIAGGVDAKGRAVDSAELFDPATGTFTTAGRMTTRRYGHTATRLPDGRVLLAGGRAARHKIGPEGKSWALASAELFDPASRTFSRTADMGSPRLGHSATALPDGRVLIIGGFDRHYGIVALVELFDPVTGTFEVAAGPLRALATGDPTADLWTVTVSDTTGAFIEDGPQYVRRFDGATGAPIGSMRVDVTGCRWDGIVPTAEGLWLFDASTDDACYGWFPFDGSAPRISHQPHSQFLAAATGLGGDLWFVGVRSDPDTLEDPNPPGNLWRVTQGGRPRLVMRGVDDVAAAGGVLWLARNTGVVGRAPGILPVFAERGVRFDPRASRATVLPVVVTYPYPELDVEADRGMVLFEGRSLLPGELIGTHRNQESRLFIVRAANGRLVRRRDRSIRPGRSSPGSAPIGGLTMGDGRMWALGDRGGSVWSAPIRDGARLTVVLGACDPVDAEVCTREWFPGTQGGGGDVPGGIWVLLDRTLSGDRHEIRAERLDTRSLTIDATIEEDPFAAPATP